MKRTFLLQAFLAAVLLFGITVYAGRLLGAAGPAAHLDPGGRHPATVPAELRRLLRGLDGELAATLFVSGRERMPSHLRQVEETARALLEEMEAAAAGRFSYRVVDPGLSGPAGARYAASRRASPIRVRRVVDDAESQAEIWSSLVFSRQGRPRREDILIQGIENAHLPHLARLVSARLAAGESAPQAAFAVSAPTGYGRFPRYLSQHGPVLEIDVDAGGFIPRDVDVLFWLEPRRVTRQHIAELRRFLASGRTAVLAGSAYRVRYSAGEEGEVRFRVEGMGSAWERLLEPFGLEPVADLVMDRNAGPVTVSVDGVEREVEAPFHLRNLPAFRDFRPFRTPARGGLSFTAASPLRVDPRRVAAAGYQAHVAATTTEHAWVRPLPEGEFGLEDLPKALPVPKQNLMVLLTPEDPWAGQLLVLASASPFRDEILEQAGYGHAVFVRDLARTFADPERLARQRVDRGRPASLPVLSGASRVGWRLAVAGLVPLLWAGLALRTLRGGVRLGGWYRRARGAALLAGSAAVAVALLFLALRGPLGQVRWDLTAAGVHTPDASVVDALRNRAGELRAELVLSPRSQLPPGVRAVADRLQAVLSGAGVEVEVRRPVEGRAPPVPAFEVERVRQDTSVTTEIHSGLVLHQDGRSTTIPRLDGHTGAHLDFLLAAALKRLDEGRAPVITVISDLPRLSPAEAHEDYQKKGLSAPQGVDVHARAKQLLREYGYDVRHVPLREPVFPEHPGAVIWFQPRRDSTPVLTWLSRHLARGGRAVVAMQHFNIQQRQYRGTGFGTVHWPQPQFQDFDRYLRLFGVEQVREVLMDRSRHHLELDTQVNRAAVREYDPQRVALPFLIRALGSNHSSSSPVTGRLGDLLFIWGNRFRVDAAALREAGLRAEVLATTTDRAWSYDWSGGWLPPETLRGGGYLSGPQSLALTLEGRFPAVETVDTEGGGTRLQRQPVDGARDGWMLLLGSSEMFKNHRLFSAGFAHDQLLLNAAAMVALGPRMTELQGRARAPARGFPAPGAEARATWRLAVIGGAPLALALVGLWRWRRSIHRRPRP